MSSALQTFCSFLAMPSVSVICLVMSLSQLESAEIMPLRYAKSSTCCRALLPDLMSICLDFRCPCKCCLRATNSHLKPAASLMNCIQQILQFTFTVCQQTHIICKTSDFTSIECYHHQYFQNGIEEHKC